MPEWRIVIGIWPIGTLVVVVLFKNTTSINSIS
jgi:hypothetical protein